MRHGSLPTTRAHATGLGLAMVASKISRQQWERQASGSRPRYTPNEATFGRLNSEDRTGRSLLLEIERKFNFVRVVRMLGFRAAGRKHPPQTFETPDSLRTIRTLVYGRAQVPLSALRSSPLRTSLRTVVSRVRYSIPVLIASSFSDFGPDVSAFRTVLPWPVMVP